MPKNVILVHGYSVRSLSAYGQFPALLVSEGFDPADIELSAFDSLDNSVTCDDLAIGLETQIHSLEGAGLDVASSAFVVHSTGAIVTRRWILNRLADNKTIPSHFVSLAGANHGSTLAQLGQSSLNRLHDDLQGADGIGQQVLTDLDYGSAFLRKLNRDWLTALNAGKLNNIFLFSMIGDYHEDPIDQFFWQTKEIASDSTVRICGSNLNYTWVTADPNAVPPVLRPEIMKIDVPHLILHGFSHTGDKGIIDSVRTTRDGPFAALMEAFRVVDQATYAAVRSNWAATTNAWNAQNGPGCSSMFAFRLTDDSGRPIPDSLIVLTDHAGNTQTIAPLLQPHQPIQNEVDGSAVTFYVMYQAFSNGNVVTVQIQPKSGSPLIDYEPVDYDVSANIMLIVQPNETTYIDVSVNRNVSNTYRIVNYSTNPDMNKQWPPLP
jgi:hypothetical protein